MLSMHGILLYSTMSTSGRTRAGNYEIQQHVYNKKQYSCQSGNKTALKKFHDRVRIASCPATYGSST
jgi:hypothetical protein